MKEKELKLREEYLLNCSMSKNNVCLAKGGGVCNGDCIRMKSYRTLIAKRNLMIWSRKHEHDVELSQEIAKVMCGYYAMPLSKLSDKVRHMPSVRYCVLMCRELDVSWNVINSIVGRSKEVLERYYNEGRERIDTDEQARKDYYNLKEQVIRTIERRLRE